MNSNFVVKLALSTVFIAVPAMTASTAGFGSTNKVSAKKAGPQKAYGWAKKAEKEIAKGRTERALTFAELAVEADLQNRDYRALLARIYMSQGRFVAAERTLMDVIELGQVDPRTVISLALARIAQGNVASAVALVEANQSILPVSDYALTLALAGRTSDAIAMLTNAIRTDYATARTRQNLALAYALDNRWREARVMASQDMAQSQVNERIAEWAQYARPEAYTLRVAGLLKVRPNLSDTGQPVRLALNSVPAMQLAQIEVQTPPADYSSAAPVVELAAVGPTPVADSIGFSAVESDVKLAEATPVAPIIPIFEAPLIKAALEPVKTAAAEPVKLAMVDIPASKPAANRGTHVVQLGAFSSAANADAAWSKYSKRFGVLKDSESTSVSVTVNGRKFVRLAVTGFDGAGAANAACRQIKAQGGVCFVRADTVGAPVRLASKAGRTVASR